MPGQPGKPTIIPDPELKSDEEGNSSEGEDFVPRAPTFKNKKKKATVERQKSFVEVLHIKEKNSIFRKAIPKMNICLAILLCILNFIIPGSGTLLSTFAVCAGCKTEFEDVASPVKYTIAAAIFQVLLTPLILLGYIWSCYWGVLFCIISRREEANPTKIITVKRHGT